MEDLRRDTTGLAKPDRGAFLAHRLEQMHCVDVTQAEGRVCGRRAGPGPPRVIAAPWPADVPGAARAAALISIAKGWDGEEQAPRETWFCMGEPLPLGERVEVPEGLTTATDLAAVDYRQLQGQVVDFFKYLE